MYESPLLPNSDLISFTIKSNGSDILDSNGVISIVINLEKNIADEAIITLFDVNQMGAFQIADYSEFSLDKEIEIRLGYDNENNKLFKGRVTQKKIIINSDSDPYLQVTCKHVNDKREVVPDTKGETLLELTYGHDILEVELYTNSEERNLVSGYLKFPGSEKARVGDSIKLRGFEKVFPNNKNNVVFISRVSHKVEEGNWITTVTVGKID